MFLSVRLAVLPAPAKNGYNSRSSRKRSVFLDTTCACWKVSSCLCAVLRLSAEESMYFVAAERTARLPCSITEAGICLHQTENLVKTSCLATSRAVGPTHCCCRYAQKLTGRLRQTSAYNTAGEVSACAVSKLCHPREARAFTRG